MTEQRLILYIKRFFSGTLLSRISGMVRDLVMAFSFGDHPSVAAFMVAFRLSNLFRRLLGEGPLQSAFIPQFEGLRVQDPERSSLFFRQLTLFIAAIVFVITLVAEGGIIFFLHRGELSVGNQEILRLTGWLFPGILFICLYGLNISLLNCYDSFFIPSVAPFICNLIWITAAFSLKAASPDQAMLTLSKWIAVGFFSQWLFTLPFAQKHAGLTIKGSLKGAAFPEIKTLAASFAAGAIGVGAVQINAFVDVLFARYADIRGPAYLWYSIRIEQLALAIFGIACVTTVVPRISRAIKSAQLALARSLFSLSYERVMTVMIPCTFGILALGTSTVSLLYGRGTFSPVAVSQTTLCLWAYGLGLVPTTLVILFSALFYAQSNFRLPLKISLITVGINIALNAFFVWVCGLGAISTALATSFSAWVNSYALQGLAARAGWPPSLSLSRLGGITLASVCGALCAIGVDYLFFTPFSLMPLWGSAASPERLSLQLAHFSAQAVSFLGGTFAYAALFKCSELTGFARELLVKKELSRDQ